MDIDALIRAEIAGSGKSQADIARESGLPSATVNRIANGRRNAGSHAQRQLCRALPGLADKIGEALGRAS